MLKQVRQEQAEETGGTLALERSRVFESVTFYSFKAEGQPPWGGQEGDGILIRCPMEPEITVRKISDESV